MKELRKLLANIDPEILSKRERELLRLITSGVDRSDRQIADLMWPKDKHQIVYLRQTKDRIMRHLGHIVMDLKENSPYQGRVAECHKEFMALQILRSLGMRQELVFYAERLIRRALRLELSDIITAVADALYLHYGSLVGDAIKAKKYLAMAEEHEQIQLAERKAQRLFISLASHFTRSYVGNARVLEEARVTARELHAGLEQNASFRYRYYTYYVIALYAQLSRDKRMLIDICDEALIFFQGKTYPIPNAVHFLFGFELRVGLALKTKDYTLARRAVRMGLELAENIPYNYSICLSYQAMIGFHEGDDNLVIDAIDASRHYRNFPALREQWLIIDAFARFLEIDADSPFRLGKFLNEVPLYSQDKQGLNITIMVIQVLFYIKRRQFGTLIDRWDALRKYSSRYLKKDHTFRSACFLKMILMLPTHNFHPVAIERHTSPLLKKLQEYPESDVEIVPYERLWKEVVNSVEEYHYSG